VGKVYKVHKRGKEPKNTRYFMALSEGRLLRDLNQAAVFQKWFIEGTRFYHDEIARFDLGPISSDQKAEYGALVVPADHYTGFLQAGFTFQQRHIAPRNLHGGDLTYFLTDWHPQGGLAGDLDFFFRHSQIIPYRSAKPFSPMLEQYGYRKQPAYTQRQLLFAGTIDYYTIPEIVEAEIVPTIMKALPPPTR
jgi:hypothetical protein